jgi:hypothetical protein
MGRNPVQCQFIYQGEVSISIIELAYKTVLACGSVVLSVFVWLFRTAVRKSHTT